MTRSRIPFAPGGLAVLAIAMGLALPLPVASAAPDAGPATDDRGFVDSAARCPAGQAAVALGRTRRSQVVICATGNGGHTYRAARVSDGAALQAEATATDGGYVARTDGATYTVSPTELVVVSGGRVIYRDTWIDYLEPGH